MRGPFSILTACVIVTVLGGALDLPWLPGLLSGMTLLVFLVLRRALVMPLLAATLASLLTWWAIASLPAAPAPGPIHGAAVLRVDRMPEPPSEGRRAVVGRVVRRVVADDAASGEDKVEVIAGQRARVDIPGYAGPYVVGDELLISGPWRGITFELFSARGLRYRASSKAPPLVLTHAEGASWGVARALQRARDGLSDHIGRCLGETSARFTRAFVLGIRGGVDREERGILARSGVLHLFAISGLHLGVLGALLYWLTRALLGRWRAVRLRLLDRRIAAGATIVITLGYALMTGPAISTSRAWVMLSLYLMARLVDREADSLYFLYVAVSVLLLWNPSSLFDPSLQLSVAGVGALLLTSKQIRGMATPGARELHGAQERAAAIATRIRLGMLATWMIFLATTPVILWHFEEAPLLSPLINLVAVPVFSLAVLPLSFSLVLASALFPSLAQAGAPLLEALLSGSMTALGWSAAHTPTLTSRWGILWFWVPAMLITAWWLRREPAGARSKAA